MSKRQTSKPSKQNLLRAQAEAKLVHGPLAEPMERPAEELLHELRVHQIELEMQNEALRKSQLALEMSRDRYMDIYEFSPVGFITLTRDGLISEINLAGAALLGVERSKLTNRRFPLLVSPTDRERWHRIFMHTLQHGKHPGCELQLQHGDGSFHAQLDGIHSVKNGDMAMVRFTLTDITERFQAHAREERLRHILDNTLDMIFIFSPDTLRFMYANQGAIKCLGYNREELLQMTPLSILQLISEAECRAFIAPLSNGQKETLRFETALICRSGKELPVEARLQLVHEQDDGSLFVAIVRDITKRKLAENELRRQKNLMHQVIDTDPNMIFVRDEAGRFWLANQATADYYGVPIRNLIGNTSTDFERHPQETFKFLASDREVIGSGREAASTESALMPDGKRRWYLTIKRPLPAADGAMNILGVAVDITDLNMSNIKLSESYRELQQLSLHLENIRTEERTQIARNLHDEMGAILATLKMRVAWLASRLPEGMPHLAAEADHISELVTDGIRTVRQITSDLRPNLLDDVGLVAAIKDYVKKFQRDTEIDCTLTLPEENFPLDANQSVTVFRILQESLNNIAKHAKASTAEILITLLEGSLLLRIRDNGIGFDPDRRTRSFGLLGVKERALMIGGEASIDSAPGQGTCVSLDIPLTHDGQAELDYS